MRGWSFTVVVVLSSALGCLGSPLEADEPTPQHEERGAEPTAVAAQPVKRTVPIDPEPRPTGREGAFYCTKWRWTHDPSGSQNMGTVFCAITPGECETVKYFERPRFGGPGAFSACFRRKMAVCARMVPRDGGVEREVCNAGVTGCILTQYSHEQREFKTVLPCRERTYAEIMGWVEVHPSRRDRQCGREFDCPRLFDD